MRNQSANKVAAKSESHVVHGNGSTVAANVATSNGLSASPAASPAALPTAAPTAAAVELNDSAMSIVELPGVITPSLETTSVDTAAIQKLLIEFVVEQTGYPEEIVEMDADLEADLGIDSIKKAQLFGEVGAHFDIERRDDLSLDEFSTLRHVMDFILGDFSARQPVEANPMEAETDALMIPAAAPESMADFHETSGAEAFDVEELRKILVDFVIEQTGYPEEIVELDADLEADLGIDSIKKAQLFGEVGARFNIAPRDDLSLDEFSTLRHVLDFVQIQLSDSSPHENGLQHGMALRNQIQYELAHEADSWASPVEVDESQLSAEMRDELRGIAEGANVNPESVVANNHRPGRMQDWQYRVIRLLRHILPTGSLP